MSAREWDAGDSGLLALFQSVFYAAGIKQTEAAQASGLTEKHVSQMLRGKGGTLTAWDGLVRAALALHDAKVRAEALSQAADDWCRELDLRNEPPIAYRTVDWLQARADRIADRHA